MSGFSSSLASADPLRAPEWLAPIAGGVPLAYYIAAASAHGGLYEEGTFIAAARSLGVPHPPGAPLTSLCGAFAALLPVGPLSFRVAVTSALFAAITLALFARALYFSLLGIGLRDPRRGACVALAATWFVSQTPLFIQHATRPNVYALQYALALIVIEALVRFEASEPTDDRRTLYFAAFVQGLSFANHHVFGLLMLSVAAPTLGRVFARRGFLGLMGHVAAPILGFSAYVYVPIRGGRLPFLNIGEPSSLRRTLWVLGADPWWGPNELPAGSALGRLLSGLDGGHPALGAGLSALALAGFAISARSESQRRFAVLWLLALLVPFASIAWFLEPKLTHEAWSALVPCALALVALASAVVALGLEQLARRFRQGAASLALALCAAALLGLVLNAEQRGGARFTAPDLLDDLSYRNLPTRAALLSHDAGTWFRLLGAQAEEQLRADLLVVPLAFLAYPRARDALREAAPELAPLLRSLARSDELRAGPVRALASARPVLVELERRVAPALYPALEGDGLFERVLGSPLAADPSGLRAREAARFRKFYAAVGAQAKLPELAARLARTHGFKGLCAASVGQRDAALMHVRFGLALTPDDARLLRLQAALATRRALDPTAFLREERAANGWHR